MCRTRESATSTQRQALGVLRRASGVRAMNKSASRVCKRRNIDTKTPSHRRRAYLVRNTLDVRSRSLDV